MSRRAQSDNRTAERRSLAHLRRALDLARPHHPHPNPRVGALVVAADGAVVGEGAHRVAGLPHAEVEALRRAGSQASGATVYVTLEPCDHHGRTPPCTEALIDAGVARVVIGVGDPDDRVAGRGIARLRAAGVEVVEDALVDEALELDPGYFHHRRTGRPLVTLKLAGTFDGQAAAADGTSRWITGQLARRDAHLLRARSDVVMVGAGTLRTDDPRLDVRLDGYEGPQPRPVIVAGAGRLPSLAQVYGRSPLIYRAAIEGDEPETAEVTTLPDGSGGVDLDGVVKDLGARGILDVLVEGGPTLAGALLAANLVDRLVIYLGAKLAGGVGRPIVNGAFTTLTNARDVTLVDLDRLGDDVKLVARLEREP